jgi:hypothetical protein
VHKRTHLQFDAENKLIRLWEWAEMDSVPKDGFITECEWEEATHGAGLNFET